MRMDSDDSGLSITVPVLKRHLSGGYFRQGFGTNSKNMDKKYEFLYCSCDLMYVYNTHFLLDESNCRSLAQYITHKAHSPRNLRRLLLGTRTGYRQW